MHFNSIEQLETLIKTLVSWDSRTGTQGEKDFPKKLKNLIDDIKMNNVNVELINNQTKESLVATYRSPSTNDAILLVSHFDTVHTQEYGEDESLAFDVDKLTSNFLSDYKSYSDEVQKDILSHEYLFGRGIMDMKMGLATHIHILERASVESWPINLIVLTVCDEEVDSLGMRESIGHVLKLIKDEALNLKLILNSEPSFAMKPLDENYYVYNGSIGKVMPSALSYGVETHVGEPLKGLSAHYISSYITRNMEFSNVFEETYLNETTPLPVTLQTLDLKKEYSTQTSNHLVNLYNVFTFKQTANEIFEKFNKIVKNAIDELHNDYQKIFIAKHDSTPYKVSVMSYNELMKYSINKFGEDIVTSLKAKYVNDPDLDDREKCYLFIDDLIERSKELAPLVVTYFSPPYYPPVNNSDNEVIEELNELITKKYKDFNQAVKFIHYFNGISDLSYVSFEDDLDSTLAFELNTPVWNETYRIPFEEIKQLEAPYINVGPFGKDPHKLTERLNKKSAFQYTPEVIKEIIFKFIN